MAANPTLGQIGVGGEFTTVNGANQKRYAAFGTLLARSDAESSSTAKVVAAYNFDSTDLDGAFDDGSGAGRLLKATVRKGGAVRSTAHGAGQAVVFPDPCDGTACPRLVLRTAASPALNPGASPIRYGASVRLTAEQTSDGQNVLQKGNSTSGGQYKLQVDKRPGKPSCAMSDKSSPTIYLAKSTVTVADGSWHSVECRRSGTALTVLVDGVVRGSVAVPAGLSVDNTAPLTFGGKGLAANNDQFQGALDDAWVAIG
jgi:hypothetical protein